MLWTLMALLMAVPGDPVGGAVLKAVATEEVRRLGHGQYRVRESASRELLRLGPAAVGPLRAGAASTNAERAVRCRNVLAMIEAADREEKLARLIGDPSAPPPDGLPLLGEFLKVAGDGREARELYAKVYRENGPVLMTAAADPTSTTALEHVCEDLRRLRYPTDRELAPTEFAWACFLASRAATRTIRGTIEDGLQWSLWNGRAIKLLRQAEPGSPLRRLVFAALERHRDHQLFWWGGTRLLYEARMRDAVPVLLRIAADPGAKLDSRAHALALMAALGDGNTARELRAHSTLFSDNAGLGGSQLPSDYGLPVLFHQFRDVALGACAELEGRDLDELGFLAAPRKIHGWEPYKYAFLDDASRAAAFEKWKKLPPPDPK
jgi:hypothetical protein